MNEKKCNFNIEKHNKYLYVMDYPYDYGLDEILREGTRSIKDLATFVQKRFSLKRKPSFRCNGFACTTFNFADTGDNHLLARNFDYKNGPCLVVRTYPENGYKSIAVAAMNCMLYGFLSKPDRHDRRLFLSPYACMDGINEKGLSIAVLQVKTKPAKQPDNGNSVVTTVAIRAVLDKCATVDEAVEFFKSHAMNDLLGRNYHYQLADATGKTAVIEYVENRIYVYSQLPYMHVENFFITPGGDNRKGVGFTRRKWLDAMYEKNNGVMTEKEAFSELEKVKLHYRSKRGYIVQTLWSEVFNCTKKNMIICVGSDFSKYYTFSL